MNRYERWKKNNGIPEPLLFPDMKVCTNCARVWGEQHGIGELIRDHLAAPHRSHYTSWWLREGGHIGSPAAGGSVSCGH